MITENNIYKYWIWNKMLVMSIITFFKNLLVIYWSFIFTGSLTSFKYMQYCLLTLSWVTNHSILKIDYGTVYHLCFCENIFYLYCSINIVYTNWIIFTYYLKWWYFRAMCWNKINTTFVVPKISTIHFMCGIIWLYYFTQLFKQVQ